MSEIFAGYIYGKGEARPEFVRFMTLRVYPRQKPCLPSMLMEWVMPRISMIHWSVVI